jgi:hypothetical protein
VRPPLRARTTLARALAAVLSDGRVDGVGKDGGRVDRAFLPLPGT